MVLTQTQRQTAAGAAVAAVARLAPVATPVRIGAGLASAWHPAVDRPAAVRVPCGLAFGQPSGFALVLITLPASARLAVARGRWRQADPERSLHGP